MSNVAMTNYEMNKQAYASEKYLIDADKVTKDINNAAYDFDSRCCKYVGLLCRERNDYTIFKLGKSKDALAHELSEILNQRGIIVDVVRDKNSMSDTYQCWVRERRTEAIDDLINENAKFKWTPQVWMYMLFDATDWVVEVE